MTGAARFSFTAIAALWFGLAGCAEQPGRFSGRVVRVLDGDTLEVLREGRVHRVRLHAIDCPERGQDFGTAARRFTDELAYGKTVNVQVVNTDRYGRSVSEVILPGGRNLNLELVKAGLAWWYRYHAPSDKRLEGAEREARSARRGIWSRPGAVPPWEFRKTRR